MRSAGPRAYRDIQIMLDTALTQGGAEFDMPTREAATKVVQQCHQFRTQQRKIMYENTKRMKPSNYGQLTEEGLKATWEYDQDVYYYHGLECQYDRLVIRRPKDTVVRIEVKPDIPFIAARRLDGTPIEFVKEEFKPKAIPIDKPIAEGDERPPGYFNPNEPLSLEIADDDDRRVRSSGT